MPHDAPVATTVNGSSGSQCGESCLPKVTNAAAPPARKREERSSGPSTQVSRRQVTAPCPGPAASRGGPRLPDPLEGALHDRPRLLGNQLARGQPDDPALLL